ncbi:zinc-binding dehydrogenase [Nocardia bovistercoris]|uniref:Zinc-binding dehydrogenase n=1 Tax=Nocardia bovistercoris TaxID=2785916 RepID=A0A931N4W9_9NOCA|nr:zinc-binding dehydrogenase [Nocardia bovistercoris]MBH0779269.1 zinc-binding dehydrogenase [Nocardia bovistercoris]
MRAVVAKAGAIEVQELPDPTPGPGQVLVAPSACGICGSDLHLLETQAAMPDLVPAIVLGHEYVGTILDYGPDTERTLPIGSVVTSVPYLDQPDGPQLIGLSPTVTGALADVVVLQESRLVSVPSIPQPEYAALTEPLAVGVHAVGAADLAPGDVALVVGCGPVGLSVIAALKAVGSVEVVAADYSSARRALAEKFGADVVVDPAQTSPYTAWAQLAGPEIPPSPLVETLRRPRTVVFECVGAPGVLNSVMESATPHTRIVVVGVCQQPDTITPAIAIVKELALRFAFAYRPDEFARASRWITDGTVDVGPLVTATRTLADAAGAFADLRNPEDHCKILLTP